MQEVTEASRSETGRVPRSRLSPGKAFAVLGVVLVAAGAVLLVTRPEAEPPATGIPESKNFALTNSEAIERFKDLHSLLLSATRDRDDESLPRVLTPDGHAMEKATAAISELKNDRVLDLTRVQTVKARVTTNTADLIHVDQESVLSPCFMTSSGKDVTTSHDRIARTVRWTLRQEAGVWLIDQGDLLSERTINAPDHCG
jgi:hypothetical protein